MRVLRIVGGLDPAFGGPSESAVHQCVATQMAGVDNTLLYPFHPALSATNAAALERLRSVGVTTRSFPISRVAGRHSHRWALSAELSAWAARHLRRYDLLHLHSAWGAAQVVGLQTARLAMRPCVMTPHESLTRFDIDTSGTVPPQLKRRLRRWYMSELALIVFSSSLEERDSMLTGASARTVVIPHPVVGIVTDGAAATRHLRGAPVVGFLGRLHPKKNLELLIRAVAHTPATRLVIAGDGPSDYRQALEALVAECELRARVRWLGFVRGHDRDRFLDGVDVLAMPSTYECFGMAAAEAMARGVPPIVTNQCGIAEVIARRACGFVVGTAIDDWVTVLSALKRDRALMRLGERSVEAAAAELSLESFGTSMQRAYDDLAT